MIFSGEPTPQGRAEYANFRIISLPEDSPELRQALQDKLEEYGRRLKQISNPDPTKTTYLNWQHIDLMYKQLLLIHLLRRGEVNTDDVKHELTDKVGGVDEAVFNNAAGVIEDYVRTGGKNLRYGSGLRKG